MDKIQKSLKTMKRCRKSIWKSLKKANPLSCFRRSKKSKRTTDNVHDGVLVTAVEGLTLRQESTAIEIDDHNEEEQLQVQAPSITEEGNEHVTSNTNEQLPNNNGEGRRKRKRANKKCRNNMTSQNATTEHIADIIDGDGTASLDLSPRSPVESQKELMAAVIDVPIEVDRFPSETSSKKEEVITNGKKTNRKRRKNAKSHIATEEHNGPLVVGDATLSLEPSPIEGTALVESGTNVSPSVELNDEETEHSESRDFEDKNDHVADFHTETVQEESMAEIINVTNMSDLISSETFTKKDEGNTNGKKTNRRRRKNAKSQKTTREDIGDINEGDGTASRVPSPNKPIEVQKELMAAVINVPDKSDEISSETSSKKEEENTHGKKTNRKRRKNKSRIPTEEQARKLVEGDDTMSLEPTPISTIEGTALVESETNVSPTVNLKVDATEHSESQDFDGKNDHVADFRSETLQKESMAAVINVPDESDRIPSESSSKEEEGNIYEKRTNGTLLWNAESQNKPEEQTRQLVEGDVETSIDPSPNSSNEEKTSSAEVNNVGTEPLGIRAFGDGVINNKERRTPTVIINSTGDGETRRKVFYVLLSSNTDVVLNKSSNAWVPTIAMKQVATNVGSNTTEETNKGVRSILNKISSKNIDDMIKSFMALPINTVERLENAVDLIFEKAIREQRFAHLYAVLCSAVKSVEVTENNKTTSFKILIVKKCQSFFEADKVRQTALAKLHEQIDSCNDQEKKKELQFEYEENERISRRRSVGNCCFIGELFNQHIIIPKIIQHCITYLICQRSEEPIECLCHLLRTTGRQLEQRCDLKDTFNNLNALVSMKGIPSRIRFMIRDVIDLRKNKWSPGH